MKSLTKIATLPLLLFSLAVFSPVAKADNMSFVGVSGAVTPSGGEYVGPYFVTANGSEPLPLFCLNLDRNMGVGDTWVATRWQLSTESDPNVKGAAILLSLMDDHVIDATEAQLEIWAILDEGDARGQGFNDAMRTRLIDVMAEANGSLHGNDFYNQFTLFTSNSGTQQDFLGRSVATTPEPSSLLLLGTGLFGSAGMLYRRARARCQ